MLSRLVLAALIYPLLQAALFALGVTAADGADWTRQVADPVGQVMAAALLVGLPLAWAIAPSRPPKPDDRFRQRLKRLAHRRPRPAEVRWPPRP